jgi:hypothetical protein
MIIDHTQSRGTLQRAPKAEKKMNIEHPTSNNEAPNNKHQNTNKSQIRNFNVQK